MLSAFKVNELNVQRCCVWLF